MARSKKPAPPKHPAIDFSKSILPILEANCFKCHRAPRTENGRTVKPKGGLELDSRAGIEAGSEFTKVVIPGDPLNSPLYSLAALPADHDDRMPAKGDRLSFEQLQTIKRWIKEGAKFGEWQGGAARPEPVAMTGRPPVAKAPEPPEPAPKKVEKPAPPEPVSLTPASVPSKPAPPAAPSSGAQEIDFENTVLPIIKTRCFTCHEAVKQENGRTIRPKASLRLDGRGWILKGSENGKVLVPGKPDESPLYMRTALPPDHDDRMPSKGDPLTRRQQEVLKNWILKGAKFGQWRGAPGGIVATVKGPEGGPVPLLRAKRVTTVEELGKSVTPATKLALEKAEKSGGRISVAVPGTPLLRVQFLSREQETGDDQVAALAPVASQITHLLLGRTKVGDGAMKTIGKFRNLTRLDLNRTQVTDAGLSNLKGLSQLRSLNLFGTAATDAAVDVLAGLKNLEVLYLRDTKITDAGVERLRKSLPNTRIVAAFTIPVRNEPPDNNRRRR